MTNAAKTKKVRYVLTPEQLRKLISIRADIQTFNLDLLKYVDEIGFDKLDWFHRSFCQTLLGSNFSLWRFTFLLYEKREADSVEKAMRRFITKLAEDNTMLFSREVDTQAWLGGYYGNNSRFRIQRLIEKIEEEYDLKNVKSIKGACTFSNTMKKFYGLRAKEALNSKESLIALTTQFEMQKRLFKFIKTKVNTQG